MKLASCSGCSRHVKEGARECPFCGAPPRSGPEPVAQKRAVRAAMLAGAAAVGVACGGILEPSPADASADAAKDTGSVVVPYGVPPFDASIPGPDASTIPDASTKDVTIAPPYGTPPPPPQDH